MKDVAGTLKRIDEEIVGHKQAIARHQIEIVRLQDTRSVLMHLVEDDIAAAEASRSQERHAILAGQGSKPMIVVRKVTEDESPPPSKTMHAKNGSAVKTGKPRGKRVPGKSESGDYREKILGLVDTETPMSSQEIGDHLGLPRNETARKAMSNALYQLRVKGQLLRGEDRRYVRPAS